MCSKGSMLHILKNAGNLGECIVAVLLHVLDGGETKYLGVHVVRGRGRLAAHGGVAFNAYCYSRYSIAMHPWDV